MKPLRIVFMGTPHFAIPTLEHLRQAGHIIAGVVTPPDKPRGRGKKLLPPPVKEYALEHQLGPVLQPERLKDESFVSDLRLCDADLFVVVAFRILPEAVFALPPLGTINLHPSKLPKYRGAAPIPWSIIRGEIETAITTIFIQKEIDAGNIILQEACPISADDTAGTLHDRLAVDGAALVLRSIQLIQQGAVTPWKQDDQLASPAPKITKETCHLNFDQPAVEVRNWIRGLSPWPGAYAMYGDLLFKIFSAAVLEGETTDAAPGTLIRYSDQQLWIACNPGVLALQEVQLQGRKRLAIADFLRGFQPVSGKMLS